MGLTLSRSCVVKASLLTRPILSISIARVTRIRLRAMGIGKDFSRTPKNLCVSKGGFIWGSGEGGAWGSGRSGSNGGCTYRAGTDGSDTGCTVVVSSTPNASLLEDAPSVGEELGDDGGLGGDDGGEVELWFGPG